MIRCLKYPTMFLPSVICIYICRLLWGIVVVVQSVSITTKVVKSNSAHGEVYSIQHYVRTFASDLRQVGSFLPVLRFPPPITMTSTIWLTEILLKVALNTITKTPFFFRYMITTAQRTISLHYVICNVYTITYISIILIC